MRINYRQRNRFRNYLSIMAFVIIAVLLAFRLIPDKKTASVLTSLIFIGSSVGVILWERKYPGYQKRPSYWGTLAFLIFSALPIFALRLIYWDLEFDHIEFLGMTGSMLHRASNNVFIVMMVCYFADAYMETSRRRQEQEKERLSQSDF